MKTVLAVTFLLLSSASNSWEIIKEKDNFYLVDSKLQIKKQVLPYEERTAVEVVPLSLDIVILRYLEGKGGTKYLSQTYNCSIFNSFEKNFVTVDQLCKSITTLESGKTTESVATFKIDKDNLIYRFEDLNGKFSLSHSSLDK